MNSIFKIKKIIYKYFPFIVNVKNTIANRKRKASYGKENPDKIFYVFGCKDDTGGLWWHINKSLMHIAYAVDNGYIAVIDMQNFHNQYTEDSKFGKINVWEIFFQQPMGYTLEDIAHSKNIILSKKAPYPNHKYWMGQSEFYDNEDRIKYFHNLFSKYIKFNNKTKEYLQKQYENILSGKGRVVGVLCRGTDYVLYRPKGHPVQPEPQDVIKDVKNFADQATMYLACVYDLAYTSSFVLMEKLGILEGLLSAFDKYFTNDYANICKTELLAYVNGRLGK